jgi:hypothetical protein
MDGGGEAEGEASPLGMSAGVGKAAEELGSPLLAVQTHPSQATYKGVLHHVSSRILWPVM